MLYLLVTTEESIAKDFEQLSINDGDFNGENGWDWTSDKAVKRGLSDQHYAVLMADKVSRRKKERVKEFVKIFLRQWEITSSSYYSSFDFEIEKIGSKYAVAIEIN